MRYIVSGVHRSGTSMMMKCLIDGGISPIWDNYRELSMRQNDRNDYKLNPDGFWEVGQRHYMKLGYTSTLPDDICVKIQAIGLPILSSGDYKIIFMRRNPEAIIKSYIKSFGQDIYDKEYGNRDFFEYYENLTGGVIDIMSERKDVELIEMDYNYVVDHPLDAMKQIKDFGVPIDLSSSIKVPKREYRRNEAA